MNRQQPTRSTKYSVVYVGVAHGMRLLSVLAIIKLVSLYVGPEGLGRFGIFLSLSSMLTVFAGGGISNGITKYVAEYKTSALKVVRFLGSAALYGIIFSVIIAAIGVSLSIRIAETAFGDVSYWWAVAIFTLSPLGTFIGTISIATVNGLGRQDLFARLTVPAYSIAILASFVLIANWGFAGAVIALAFTISSAGLLAVLAIARSRLFRLIRFKYNEAYFRQLFRYTLMVITAATLFPLSEIFIRREIISHIGLTEAGYWQGMIRLSNAYIGFFTIYMAAAYMPKLSSTPEISDCLHLVARQVVIIGGTFVVCGLAIYLFRNYLILLAFSDDFLPMADFIGYQILGDFFRLISYTVGFLFVAKAAGKYFVIAECFQFGLFSILSILAIRNTGGLNSVTQIYCVIYVIYFLFLIAMTQTYIKRKKA